MLWHFFLCRILSDEERLFTSVTCPLLPSQKSPSPTTLPCLAIPLTPHPCQNKERNEGTSSKSCSASYRYVYQEKQPIPIPFRAVIPSMCVQCSQMMNSKGRNTIAMLRNTRNLLEKDCAPCHTKESPRFRALLPFLIWSITHPPKIQTT